MLGSAVFLNPVDLYGGHYEKALGVAPEIANIWIKFPHRFWLRLTKAVGFFIVHNDEFGRALPDVWRANFHDNTPPAICQAKSRTKMHKL